MIDTFNKFIVARRGDHIVILNQPLNHNYDVEEALLLAAWLVVIAGDNEKWKEILKAVEST